MKKQLLVLIIGLIITVSGCKKDKASTMINATTYLDDKRVLSNIAFIKASQTSVIKDENSVEAYFATNPAHSKLFTEQYSEYMVPGDYIIVIQIVSHIMDKSYTYRNVSITENNPSQDNVMVFNSNITTLYQPWVNKY